MAIPNEKSESVSAEPCDQKIDNGALRDERLDKVRGGGGGLVINMHGPSPRARRSQARLGLWLNAVVGLALPRLSRPTDDSAITQEAAHRGGLPDR